MKKSVFFLVLPIVLVWSACSIFSLKFEQRDLTITNLDGKTVPIRVELVRSIRELAKGYMGRDNIFEGTGMLFILKKDEKLSFWMKDTPTPLCVRWRSAPCPACSSRDRRSARERTPRNQSWFTSS